MKSLLSFLIFLAVALPGKDAVSRKHIEQAEIEVTGRALPDHNGWQATWAGVQYATRFVGRGVGVRLDDAVNFYTVEIDGNPLTVIAPEPGVRTIWLRNLAPTAHQARVIKRTESPGYPGRFIGFALDGGRWLALPPAPKRQIEFIGDSFTVGLGNGLNRHECTQAEVRANTDASRSFGIRVARHYNAAWQLNGMSGMGMVRNWSGNDRPNSFRTFYDRILQTDAGARTADARWHPQIVVIGLGANDFSAPLGPGEPWTADSLKAQFKRAYIDMIAQLRGRYGDMRIIATATNLWPDNGQKKAVEEIVSELRAAGDRNLDYYFFEGITVDGCLWHPTLADHQLIAEGLIKLIDGSRVWR